MVDFEGVNELHNLGQRELERRALVENAKPGVLVMQACSALDHFIIGSSVRGSDGELLNVEALIDTGDESKLFIPGFLMDAPSGEFGADICAVNLARKKMHPIKGVVSVFDFGAQVQLDAQSVLPQISYLPVDFQTGRSTPEWKISLVDTSNRQVIQPDLLSQLRVREDEFMQKHFSLSQPAEDGTMTLSFRIR